MIELKHITKTFRISRRNAGFLNAAKTLFHKDYETVKALNDISFAIRDGEMVGYIGPNGAGKSSTIKVMSGILTPDSGECKINGRTPWKERTAHVKEIGVVFGQRSQLWWDVPVIDTFELLKSIYEIPQYIYKRNLEELSELLQIETILKTPARQLSLGQRMRCEIAASLIHNPKILFLDEPTIGLDAVSKIAVRQFIKELNAKHGTTVILTTHDMQDIEALTERILLIGKGQILLDGPLENLKNRYSQTKKLTVLYQNGSFDPCEGILVEESLPGKLSVFVDTSILKTSQAISHISGQLDVTDFSVEGTSVDEMVVSLYQEYHI